MLKLILTILLSSIVFLGCTPKQDIQPIELNQEFITRVGQYHMTPDKDFVFGISNIVEDTRGSCPRNVSCVWDGAIIVQLKVTNLSEDGQTVYQEGMAHQRQYFGNYLLEIHKVRPRKPKRNHGKYRFTFELSQLNNDELIALEKEQQERSQVLREELESQSKVQIANIRERYENFDPRILSKADAEEIIAIEQKQARFALEYHKKMAAWNELDLAMRGPQPEMESEANLMGNNNTRRQELQAKVRGAREVQRKIDRIEKLSKTHNISILDNERAELIQLHTEQQTFQDDMNKVLLEVLMSNGGQINANALNQEQLGGALLERLPKDILKRMSEIGERVDAIQSPFEAAEKGDEIREKMIKLSETSGIAISSGEIAETIALNAEKDIILKRTQIEAGRKWMAEGGPVTAVQKPLPNAEDNARLKEIEARLKAISSPLIEQE